MLASINKYWNSSSPSFSLTNNEVDIWRVPLVINSETQIRYWRLLSDEEKDRANRFKFLKDKIKYIAARGTLRLLLAQYLNIPPKRINIGYEKNGKPLCAGNLEFNVSHSGEWAVIGFTMNQIIGVDVEFSKRNIEFKEIAQRFFSKNEFSLVVQSKEAHLSAYFYNCWTRKEAFIKALGDGLSFPLDQFVVSCAPKKKT